MRTDRRSFNRALLGLGASALPFYFGRGATADVVTYTYDELGRIIRAQYSTGAIIQYCYDASGNRVELRQQITTPPQCPASPPPPPPPTPPSGAIQASPATINEGQSSTLSWTSANATSASIDNGIGAVPLNGSIAVTPSSTRTYTLTLNGPGGSAAPQATVNVTPAGFYATIQITGPGAVNLRTLANAAGYNGVSNAFVTFVVASGVSIFGAAGASAGGVAIDTGTWPTVGYTISLTLQISGNVYGGGGRGGSGAGNPVPGGAGGRGGDAINCQAPITIVVNSGGQVKGGGGGGGGGGLRRIVVGGEPYFYGGGGGGGGFPNGPGGSGNTMGGQPGSPGTTSGGGAGGLGSTNAPNGGAGGNAATNGQTAGSSFTAGGVGGGAGFAIKKNGNVVNVTNNGVITGAIT